MKHFIACLTGHSLLLLALPSFAQHVGIGTVNPISSLHVEGNLLVNGSYKTSAANPTPAQTFTLVNGVTSNIPAADSVFRIYDPGGPSGNYLGNLNATITGTPPAGMLGNEIIVESMQLGMGDSVIITDFSGSDTVLAAGNGNNVTGRWRGSGGSINLRFKSNGDASLGAGFSILVRRLYPSDNLAGNFAGSAANSLLFHTGTGAFRVGRFRNSGLGLNSAGIGTFANAQGNNAIAVGSGISASGDNAIAVGRDNIASGEASAAFGQGNTSRGTGAFSAGLFNDANTSYSVAMGYDNTTTGISAIAMGYGCEASDISCVAMGYNARASGNYATAIGIGVTASGERSIALGSLANTNNVYGALVIGDGSTSGGTLSAQTNNSFRARFAGGYRFFTSAAMTTAESCLLGAGSNAWSTTSDVRLKENFLDIDGEDLLRRISGMRLSTWNYRHQDAGIRHYGPMAQDFYAAFGKDALGTIGNDTTINQADFDGVNLTAIQALIRRTEQQQALIDQYRREVEILREEIQKEKAGMKSKNSKVKSKK